MKNTFIAIFVVVVGMITSCENKSYETGDGTYSYLRSDMVDVTVVKNVITKVVTDDGETLNIPAGKTVDVTPADTTLRWLLYYNKESSLSPISFVKNESVYVLTPKTIEEMKEKDPKFVMKTDTVKVHSVWLAKTNKYLNVNIGLWVGNTSSTDKVQSIGIIKDRVSTYGKGRIYYTLYHRQADVPVGYYTQDCYISVPIGSTSSPTAVEQDTIDVCIGHTHFVRVKE